MTQPDLSTLVPAELAALIPADFQTKTGIIAVPDLVSVHTVEAPKTKLTVTWYAFFHPLNERWPHYYVCLLDAAMINSGSGLSLYEIGAVGNKHQVDILATDVNGATLVDNAGKSTVLTENGAAVALKNGLYEASLAGWSPIRPPSVQSDMRVKHTGDCILWVISYRGKGNRNKPGWKVDLASAGFNPIQDDDGSPPDGIPGGEHDEP